MAGLQNKIVLITGASSGIGAATAVQFARAGCKLSLCGRIKENLEKTAASCIEAGCQEKDIFQLLGDLTDEDECKRTVEDTCKHFGRLDVLVNAAGYLKTMCFWNCSTSEFTRHFTDNVTLTFMMCKYAMPQLYETKGVCINLGCLAGLRPYNTLFPFSVAKAALDQFTKALALEAGPKGARVLSVNPGAVEDTLLWERSGICPNEEKLIAHHSKARPLYPLQRLTNSAEVAGVIVWLASQDASFIHGVNFPLDGGMTCMSQHLL